MKLAAYVFPGQGSQQVGMGRDLYENFASARAVFDEADAVLGIPISRLCFEGPEDELNRTINTQPALVTTSLACLAAARESAAELLPRPAYVAGHSVGEYAALAAADVFDQATAIHLARERGRLMHDAGAVAPGAMAAVIGLDEDPLAEICRKTGAWMANLNCPGQIVISGEVEHVKDASALAAEHGALFVVELKVSGAFHSPLMRPAVAGLAAAIAGRDFQMPAIPVIGNTAARLLTSVDAVRQELTDQICQSVLWQRSVERLVGFGVTTFIEFGPGEAVSGMIRRIHPPAETVSIGDLDAINALVEPARGR